MDFFSEVYFSNPFLIVIGALMGIGCIAVLVRADSKKSKE